MHVRLVQVFVLACERYYLRPEILFSVVLLEPGPEWVTFTDVECRKIIIQPRRAGEELNPGFVKLRSGLCFCESTPWADNTPSGPVGLVDGFYSVRSTVNQKDADRTPAVL